MNQKKVVLLIALVLIGVMIGGASAVVFDDKAKEGQMITVSGNITDVRFEYQSHVRSAAFLFFIDDEEWVTLSDAKMYGISSYADWETVQQIKKGHFYDLHFVKKMGRWELVQVDEILT
ncbi:MAG: hypothetical protein WA091_00035 [Minisyncoccales bacterium]